jgi:hypothetical protein
MPGAIARFLDAIQVYDVEGFTKVRLGRQGDGGYVVLDELCPGTTLYSYGVGDDISFELDLVTHYSGCTAKCFDHTIDSIPTDDPRITFKKKGIGCGANLGYIYHDIVRNNLPKMLKVDIEHNEWDWLARIFDHAEFHQIIIELHILPVETTRHYVPYLQGGRVVSGLMSPYFQRLFSDFDSQVNENVFSLYARGLARLTQNYRIFHIHGNNSLPKATLKGYAWPQLLEVSLVRKDPDLKLTPTTQTFPVPGLDFPNKTDRPDFTSILPFKVCLP